MAGTSELIDFRRAFVWLLCGMLLPSVALVAFGVVAVVNERVAVERRLETQYRARLRVLDGEIRARLDAAASAAAAQALALRGDTTAPPPREPSPDPAADGRGKRRIRGRGPPRGDPPRRRPSARREQRRGRSARLRSSAGTRTARD